MTGRLIIILMFFFIPSPLLIPAQSVISPQKAFDRSRNESKALLMIFSGSDWCLPCQRIQRNILSDSVFIRFAQSNLIVLILDFPQRGNQSPDEMRRNDSLAARFNPDGNFPLLLLLKPDQTLLSLVAYDHYSAGRFVNLLKTILEMNQLLKEYSIRRKLMGSSFEFIVTADSPARASEWLGEACEEVARIERLLSEFDASSETARVNREAAAQPVEVSRETFDLIRRCLDLSRLTSGAFDISAAVFKSLYEFKRGEFSMPPSVRIREFLRRSGFDKIQCLNGNRIAFSVPGMRINFAAIGKGYAADAVKKLLKGKSVPGGVVNASGDLVAWGTRPDGSGWKAGLANPDHPDRMMGWISLDRFAVATSGNYEQYFEHRGGRYSHNIDPRNGRPVRGLKSVSVISPAAELSDGLATAVTVLGIKEGIHLLNQLPQTYGILVDENNQLHFSKRIDFYANLQT